IAERVDPDEIIRMIIKELNGVKLGSAKTAEESSEQTEALSQEDTAEEEKTEGKKKSLFRRK
ncbi:MAG: hypothetical protein K2G31_05395, partial [Clostridia bacterium]|nr:hypothetical protein [Clostridia bacterium]